MRPFRLVPLAALLLLVPVRSPGATPNPASPTPGWEFRVAPPGESGEPFVLEGRVIGEGGAPMRDVRIYAYHADASGKYSRGENHPRLEGLGRTNALGVFVIHSVLPGTAEGNPHIHFSLIGPKGECRSLFLNLARSFGAGSDAAFGQLPWMVKLPNTDTWAYVHRDAEGVFRCRWDAPYSRGAVASVRPDAFSRLGR